MDIIRALEWSAKRGGGRLLPPGWRALEPFAGLTTVGEVISLIRRCDDRSDELMEALIGLGPDDRLAPEVVLAALLRLHAGRCSGSSERVDTLACELAIVLGEAWQGEVRRTPGRRWVNVLGDRAWGRVRTADVRHSHVEHVSFDPSAATWATATSVWDEGVVASVAVGQFESVLAASETEVAPEVVRAWQTATSLWDRESRTQTERNRWQHARRVLRRHVTPDLELVHLVEA
jgi:hypothetical protein